MTGLRSRSVKHVGKKGRSTSQLKKELDKEFSIFIRTRDKAKCYTCEKQGTVKTMQCGHFVPRQYLATRYDERNNNCQCYVCNMLYGGQPSSYAKRLKEQYGEAILDELEGLRKTTVRDFPYQKWIDYYKEKNNAIIKACENSSKESLWDYLQTDGIKLEG